MEGGGNKGGRESSEDPLVGDWADRVELGKEGAVLLVALGDSLTVSPFPCPGYREFPLSPVGGHHPLPGRSWGDWGSSPAGGVGNCPWGRWRGLHLYVGGDW